VADELGNVEVLHVTDEHPFYVDSRGWTESRQLLVGEIVVGADGRVLKVVQNLDQKSVAGVTVYNFQVADDHTYFVTDGNGATTYLWTHNRCSTDLGADMLAAGRTKNAGDQAAHMIPTSTYANANYSDEVKLAIKGAQSKFDSLLGPSMRDRDINGFFAPAGHLGTHTTKYFRELGNAVKRTGTPQQLANALDSLKARILSGEFQ